MGGQISIVVTTTSDLLEQHKAGRIRVLATSDTAALAVPAGPPDLQGGRLRHRGQRLVRRLRAGQDAARRGRRLNKAIVAAVQSPPVKERLLAFGLVPTGTSAAELRRIQKADSELWAPAVRASGFTPEQ